MDQQDREALKERRRAAERQARLEPPPTFDRERGRFVIYAMPRTGSNHFVAMLNRSPEITCHYEVFNKNRVQIRGGAAAGELESRNADPVAYLNRLYDQGPKRIVGFKLFPGHSPTILEHTLAERSIRKILLYRANGLAQYASALEARASGKWSQPAGRTREGVSKRPTFAPRKFIRHFRANQRYYAKVIESLEASTQSFLTLEYTQLSSPALLVNLALSLGISGTQPLRERNQDSSTKTGVQNICSRFANSDEVSSFLETHGLAAWKLESLEEWPAQKARLGWPGSIDADPDDVEVDEDEDQAEEVA